MLIRQVLRHLVHSRLYCCALCSGLPDSLLANSTQVLAKSTLDGLDSTLVPRDEEHRDLAALICPNVAFIDIHFQYRRYLCEAVLGLLALCGMLVDH